MTTVMSGQSGSTEKLPLDIDKWTMFTRSIFNIRLRILRNMLPQVKPIQKSSAYNKTSACSLLCSQDNQNDCF